MLGPGEHRGSEEEGGDAELVRVQPRKQCLGAVPRCLQVRGRQLQHDRLHPPLLRPPAPRVGAARRRTAGGRADRAGTAPG
jgi:hypothetical protein